VGGDGTLPPLIPSANTIVEPKMTVANCTAGVLVELGDMGSDKDTTMTRCFQGA